MRRDFQWSHTNVGSSLLRKISSKTVGNKGKSICRKKRKGKASSRVQKRAKRETETTEIGNPTPSRSRDCSDSEAE